ncbi:DedA family protein [Azospira sp. I09]|uniref:DedA family protein n=1 Tax=Azospira sp. I09 TaxID=1765049 RepID=UPI0012610996|nr:DedA family protein [Azospira sp. I09]BBN88877.1 membrane protein [Azospira sp. I09]
MIAGFVADYGYLAVFLGTLLEGETVLLAAGFAVHRGMLDGNLVFATAVLGATTGDLGAFLLGRWQGAALLARCPALARHTERAELLLERYHAPFILLMRFLYGLRIAGPLIMGHGNLPLPRFAVFNLLGAILWAALVMGAGYAFGIAIESFLADVKRLEEPLLLGILAVGLGALLLRKWMGAAGNRKHRHCRP